MADTVCAKRGKTFLPHFNCEEAALIASAGIEGHVLSSCILLLLVAVAVAAVTDNIKPQNKKNTYHELRRFLAKE